MSRKLALEVPRIALTPPEAAAALGMGEDMFNEQVRPELRVIRKGRKVLVRVQELERWARDNEAQPVIADLDGAA